jgi:hypothetical protein
LSLFRKKPIDIDSPAQKPNPSATNTDQICLFPSNYGLPKASPLAVFSIWYDFLLQFMGPKKAS